MQRCDHFPPPSACAAARSESHRVNSAVGYNTIRDSLMCGIWFDAVKLQRVLADMPSARAASRGRRLNVGIVWEGSAGIAHLPSPARSDGASGQKRKQVGFAVSDESSDLHIRERVPFRYTPNGKGPRSNRQDFRRFSLSQQSGGFIHTHTLR